MWQDNDVFRVLGDNKERKSSKRDWKAAISSLLPSAIKRLLVPLFLLTAIQPYNVHFPDVIQLN